MQRIILSMLCIFILVGGIFLLSCQERLTKDEWNIRYKPTDANQAQAMVIKEAGEQKIKDTAEMAKIERLCVVVAIGSVVAAIIVVYLKLQAFVFIPVAILFGCLAGISFIELNSHYPKILPLVGGGFILMFAGCAAHFLVVKMKVFRGLREVVEGIQVYKKNKTPLEIDELKSVFTNQSDTTKELVAEIKAKL